MKKTENNAVENNAEKKATTKKATTKKERTTTMKKEEEKKAVESTEKKAESTEKKAEKKAKKEKKTFDELSKLVNFADVEKVEMKNGSCAVKINNKRLFRLDFVNNQYQLTCDRIEYFADVKSANITTFVRYRTSTLQELIDTMTTVHNTYYAIVQKEKEKAEKAEKEKAEKKAQKEKEKAEKKASAEKKAE